MDDLATYFDRAPERRVLAAFLAQPWPAALRVRGNPGIGKTTVLALAMAGAQAAGVRLLTCAPVEAEAEVPFTSVADLVVDLDAQIADLPPPQRAALDHALVRRADVVPLGTRAVGFALATLLRTLAERQRVLVVIDDLHWLDVDSARAISFGLRRAASACVGVLAAVRTDLEHNAAVRLFEPVWAGHPSLDLGPLPAEAISAMVRARFGELPRGSLPHLHAAAGGNPLLAGRLAEELLTSEWEAPADRLPVPGDLRTVLIRELDGLPASARELCLAASALAEPTIEVLARATSEHRDVGAVLDLLGERGILRRAGRRVRFHHPLMASAIYTSTPSGQRRELHRGLAELVDTPEERARHLAHSADGPDEALAAEVLEGARAARARGAPGAASDLAIWAARLTPEADRLSATERRRVAASYLRDAGDIPKARRLLAEAVPVAPLSHRSALLVSLATLTARTAGPRAALDILAMAERHVGTNLRQRATLAAERAWLYASLGERDLAVDAALVARAAATQSTDPSSRSRALLACARVGSSAGWPDDELESLIAAAERAPATRLGPVHPGLVRALLALRAGDISGARPPLAHAERELLKTGTEAALPYVLVPLAELELLAGRWATARGYAVDAVEVIEGSGQDALRPWAIAVRAQVAAHLGELEQAQADAEAGLEAAQSLGLVPAADLNRAALAFVALSREDHAAARTALEPCVARSNGGEAPCSVPWTPDAAEALVGVGDLEEADRLLSSFEAALAGRDRPVLQLAAARSRALWLSASGERQKAVDVLERALREARRLPVPFVLARSQYALGRMRFDLNQPAAARSLIGRAQEAFDRLGASAWTELAHRDLTIEGQRRRAVFTTTEQQIVDLLLEGCPTRVIAARLFMSPRTVESHLTKIYRKSGVAGRGELVRRLLTQPTV